MSGSLESKRWLALSLLSVLISGALIVGCGSPDSKTSLNPEGPPMVQQMFVMERIFISETQSRVREQLAFGDHPDISLEWDDREGVGNAVANAAQEIRIVFDELLVGNNLEEIACADGRWSGRIADDVTPDDISDCAGPVESLQGVCTKVCVFEDGPVGILDENEDGAADLFRMLDYNSDPDITELAVSINCDGTEIPLIGEGIDPDDPRSFWNPAGNQQIPAGPLGFRGLGPVLVLFPDVSGLRTGSNCTVNFRDEVVDRDGNQVCAPVDGNINMDCTPGDTALLSFSTEPLVLSLTDPTDGADNVNVNATTIILQFNAALAQNSLADGVIFAEQGGAAIEVPSMLGADRTSIFLNVTGVYQAETTYTVTITTDLTDTFGGAFPAEEVITFTTGMAPIVPDAGPDASPADAGIDAAP